MGFAAAASRKVFRIVAPGTGVSRRRLFVGGRAGQEAARGPDDRARPGPGRAARRLATSWPHFDSPSVFRKLRAKIGPGVDFVQFENISLLGFLKPKTADRLFGILLIAAEEARASPVKRSTGGFAEEDDLFDMDEGFVEPPSNKAKSGAAPPDVAASEASAPKTVPAAQVSTASSLSKGKDVPSTAAAVTPPSEVKSSSSKLDGAVKIAAAARQEVDSLKEELGKLKEKLKEEEASRLAAEARAAEKDDLLRQSSLALLEATDIPVAALDKIPNNSPANSVSMTLAAHQLTRELLGKGKGAMARMHSMIFPKISQDKTLGQLIDVFAVDTKEVIEIFLVPPFVDDSSGALSEEDRIQRMKDRIAQMEKDLRNTFALAAIVRKKGEIAADIERYALTELHKATESLNSKSS
ncbi:hypothetical protein QYE76_061670 [Lolium multiflorum]|uniref:Uncharacterized protein n=1 Tax=Lolium multiflorum TaxID=4521 RepID=A0AAD8W6J5_LOLMU|nr:hypothetical protein QYE76_061670 [Lolium multiflorum]